MLSTCHKVGDLLDHFLGLEVVAFSKLMYLLQSDSTDKSRIQPACCLSKSQAPKCNNPIFLLKASLLYPLEIQPSHQSGSRTAHTRIPSESAHFSSSCLAKMIQAQSTPGHLRPMPTLVPDNKEPLVQSTLEAPSPHLL